MAMRFLLGGIIVALFAALGDILRPKSFAGLFGAAPSVALATLGLTLSANGRVFAAVEVRSMVVGAIAFVIYAYVCAYLMLKRKYSAAVSTLAGLALWLVLAFAGWALTGLGHENLR